MTGELRQLVAVAEPPAAAVGADAPAADSLRTRANHHPRGRNRRGRHIGLSLLDAAMLLVAFLTADLVRCAFWERTVWPQAPIAVFLEWYWYLWALPVLMVLWPGILSFLGLYRSLVPKPRWRLPVEAGVLLLLCFSTLALFFARIEYPRMMILLTSGFAPFSFMAGRWIVIFANRVRRWFNEIGLPDYDVY